MQQDRYTICFKLIPQAQRQPRRFCDRTIGKIRLDATHRMISHFPFVLPSTPVIDRRCINSVDRGSRIPLSDNY